MQPILLSCPTKHRLRAICLHLPKLRHSLSRTCLSRRKLKALTHSKNENLYTFCKLLLNGASYDITKIGCIQFLWAGAEKYLFSFLLCAGPLRWARLGLRPPVEARITDAKETRRGGLDCGLGDKVTLPLREIEYLIILSCYWCLYDQTCFLRMPALTWTLLVCSAFFAFRPF